MEFKIENTQVYGIDKSFIASGNAMRTQMEDNTVPFNDGDYKRSCRLAATATGAGHDNFLNGIIVQFDMYAPLYMWKQIQRYHFLDFISSQSTMHRLAQFSVKEQCVDTTDPVIMDRYQQLLDEYNSEAEKDPLLWRVLVASLPSGFVLGATMTTNYRQLKTIYLQRKHHKLREWRVFCKWCESLPYFMELNDIKE